MSTAAVTPFRSFVQTPVFSVSASPLRALVSSEYKSSLSLSLSLSPGKPVMMFITIREGIGPRFLL